LAIELIAELCQNHNGSSELLRKMVDAAAQSGADVVKIQAIFPELLTRRAAFEIGGSGIDRPYALEVERLSRLILSPKTEADFVHWCRESGVASMITVFALGQAERYASLGYSRVKIASYDCGSVPLLEDVGKYFKRVYVSTGASFDEEIRSMTEVLGDRLASALHAVTKYPNQAKDCHLERIDWLKREFGIQNTGWSDHTLVSEYGVEAGKAAVLMGANVIERHFSILPPNETKDGPVSIGPLELAELREFASA